MSEYTSEDLIMLPYRYLREYSRITRHVRPLWFLQRLHALSLIGCVALSRPAAAQRGNVVRLVPGVTFETVVDARGPWRYHVIRIDRRRARVELRAVRADDQLRGRERPSAMAQRLTARGHIVLAAVNADFFDLRSGENENNQVIEGEWWKGLKVTDSPFDSYDNVHAQLAIDATGRPTIDRFLVDAHAVTRGISIPILTVNANPTGMPEGTALYTPRFGPQTPIDSLRTTSEAPLRSAGRRGDTLLFVRRGAVRAASGTPIPQDGAVLSGYGARTPAITSLAEGDTARVVISTLPRLAGGRLPSTVLGGWPRIIHNGKNVAPNTATTEGTISRNAEVRHPRTAVAHSRDGNVILLVAVDGRSTASVGMTLTELADLLRRRGAWQAMNFDGGGSTTMLVRDSMVTTPSDAAGERAVGNALFLLLRGSERQMVIPNRR